MLKPRQTLAFFALCIPISKSLNKTILIVFQVVVYDCDCDCDCACVHINTTVVFVSMPKPKIGLSIITAVRQADRSNTHSKQTADLTHTNIQQNREGERERETERSLIKAGKSHCSLYSYIQYTTALCE